MTKTIKLSITIIWRGTCGTIITKKSGTISEQRLKLHPWREIRQRTLDYMLDDGPGAAADAVCPELPAHQAGVERAERGGGRARGGRGSGRDGRPAIRGIYLVLIVSRSGTKSG